MQFCISFLVFYDDLYTVSNGILPVLVTIAVTKLSYLGTLESVHWLSFIYSLFILIALTMVIGLYISSFSNSSLFIVSTGISVILTTMVVGPAALPTYMVGRVEAIKIIG